MGQCSISSTKPLIDRITWQSYLLLIAAMSDSRLAWALSQAYVSRPAAPDAEQTTGRRSASQRRQKAELRPAFMSFPPLHMYIWSDYSKPTLQPIFPDCSLLLLYIIRLVQ